jgi:hypothetical protein
MGQRANLVIVRPDGYELFYSHWCANTLPRDLFWGPEHAERFIRMQRPAGHDEWLDTIWAEGGAAFAPFLLRDDRLPIDAATRRAILAQALAQID